MGGAEGSLPGTATSAGFYYMHSRHNSCVCIPKLIRLLMQTGWRGRFVAPVPTVTAGTYACGAGQDGPDLTRPFPESAAHSMIAPSPPSPSKNFPRSIQSFIRIVHFILVSLHSPREGGHREPSALERLGAFRQPTPIHPVPARH